MSLFANAQAGLSFPVALSEKYRPRLLSDFVGLDKIKKVLTKFAANPFPNAAFLFVGQSGTGKTSAALSLCEMIGGELHHIPSQSCNLSTIEEVARMCHYVPRNNTLHVVLMDEIHAASKAAQMALLSKTDRTAFPPQTVFIGTCTTLEGIDSALLSRFMQLQFSSHGTARETASLLERIWIAETGSAENGPNFLRLTQESHNNIRDAVNSLQVELLAQ
jgi:replication-associated recombination protein RarA